MDTKNDVGSRARQGIENANIVLQQAQRKMLSQLDAMQKTMIEHQNAQFQALKTSLDEIRQHVYEASHVDMATLQSVMDKVNHVEQLQREVEQTLKQFKS